MASKSKVVLGTGLFGSGGDDLSSADARRAGGMVSQTYRDVFDAEDDCMAEREIERKARGSCKVVVTERVVS